ncbi:MAG: hypothetical protein K6B14_07385 [Lachnospiraceae bacterium]|nr:hypothetical protein [Lachnospiraceae bacterium]
MTIEQRLKNLESRFDALQNAFLQSQRNGVAVTAKADEVVTLNNKVEDITPYTVTKTAYIDDTELTFNNVPTGHITVFCSIEYSMEHISDSVIISFEPLNEVTEITIMVQ